MANTIHQPVGAWEKGAINKKADVILVQQLLQDAAKKLKKPSYDPGTIDGLIAKKPKASATVSAVIAFQGQFMRHADGLVEPGKMTWQRLQAAAGMPAPAPAPPPPALPVTTPPGAVATKLSFTGTRIALIVRGKQNAAHEPDVDAQHADCILTDGSPVGFFGSGAGWSGVSGRVGMGLDGVVADYSWFIAHRPYYVDLTLAKRYGLISTVLTVDVSATAAAQFAAYWARLRLSPGDFELLGNNCSTHASDAFVSSGILPGGIPGIDTPNNLYKQLVAVKRGLTKSYSGLVGFTKRASGGFDVEVL